MNLEMGVYMPQNKVYHKFGNIELKEGEICHL